MAQTGQEQQILQAVVAQLAQGTQPKDLMKMLTDKQMPPEQAAQLVQAGISYVEEKGKQMQMSPAEKYASQYTGNEGLPKYNYGAIVSGIAQNPQLLGAVAQAIPGIAGMMKGKDKKKYGGKATTDISVTDKRYPKPQMRGGGLSKFLPKAQFAGESMVPYAEGMQPYTFGVNEDPTVTGNAEELNAFEGPFNTAGPTDQEVNAQIAQDKHDIAMGTSFPNYEQIDPTAENIEAANTGNLKHNEPGYELNENIANADPDGELDPNKMKTGDGAVSDTDDLKRGRFWWETAPVKNPGLKQLQGLANMVVGTSKGVQDVKDFMGNRKKKEGGHLPTYQDAGASTVGGGINTASMDMNNMVNLGEIAGSDYMWDSGQDIPVSQEVQDYNDNLIEMDPNQMRSEEDLVTPGTADFGEEVMVDKTKFNQDGQKETEEEEKMKTSTGPGEPGLNDKGLGAAEQFLIGANQWLDGRDEKKERRKKTFKKTWAAGNTMGYMGNNTITPDNAHGVQTVNVGVGPHIAPKTHYGYQDRGYGQGYLAKEGGEMNLQKLFKFVGGGQTPMFQEGVNGTPFTDADLQVGRQADLYPEMQFIKKAERSSPITEEQMQELSRKNPDISLSEILKLERIRREGEKAAKAGYAPPMYQEGVNGTPAENVAFAGTSPTFSASNLEAFNRAEETPFYSTSDDYNSMLRQIRGFNGDMNAPLTASEQEIIQNAYPIHQPGKSVKYDMYPSNVKEGVVDDMMDAELRRFEQLKEDVESVANAGLPSHQDGGGTERMKRKDMPDFVEIEEGRYAPKKWVKRDGELKKGVKWIDNPDMEKEWFTNEQGEEVYAYPAQKYGIDSDAEHPWEPYYTENRGPYQYERKLGWTVRDIFDGNRGVQFQDGGLSEGDEVMMTEEQIQRYIQMGGVVEIVDENSQLRY
jgi:hypothetical protein